MKNLSCKAKKKHGKRVAGRLPKEIKVGHQTFQIKEVDLVAKSNDAEGECWGKVTFNDFTIEIQKGLNSRTKKDVLLHEVFHTILQFIGERESVSQFNDERLTESLANMTRMVFIENTTLLDLLKK